jgi:MbtH protein
MEFPDTLLVLPERVYLRFLRHRQIITKPSEQGSFTIHHTPESAMGNPFDNEDLSFLVLVNEEGQHSLWPAFADVPEGWEVRVPSSPRSECLSYIEENWTDMRPKSLVDAMLSDEKN